MILHRVVNGELRVDNNTVMWNAAIPRRNGDENNRHIFQLSMSSLRSTKKTMPS